jgi:hypothetical protein
VGRRNDIDRAARTCRQREHRIDRETLVDDWAGGPRWLQRRHTRARLHRIGAPRGATADASQLCRNLDEHRFPREQVLRQLHWQLIAEQLDQRARAARVMVC